MKLLRACTTVLIFFILSNHSIAQQSPSIEYSNEVIVTGLVYKEYFYEEKNYSETPESDVIRGACMLKLDTSLALKDKNKIEKIELIFSNQIKNNCSQLEGHRVQVTGNIDEAITGHQHGDAILSVSKEKIIR